MTGNNDTWIPPEPTLLRVYNVSGRLVREGDTPKTAAKRETEPFSFAIEHYPVEREHWNDCPTLRLVFGAHQNAWFDLGIAHVGDLYSALIETGKTHLKNTGGHYSAHNDEATLTEGLVSLCVDTYAVHWNENMTTITLGDSLGAGAEADLSPRQTEDFVNIMCTLTDSHPEDLSNPDEFDFDRIVMEANGDASTTMNALLKTF